MSSHNNKWTINDWLGFWASFFAFAGLYQITAICVSIIFFRTTAKPIGKGIKATRKRAVAIVRGAKKMLTPKPKVIPPPPPPIPPTRQELVAKETELFHEECEILRSLSHDFKVVGDIENEIELRRQKYLNRIARILK